MKSVLLVDDEIDTIRSYRDHLQEYFDVHLASSVEEALGILQTIEIHVLVVDLVMPNQDGRALLSIANSQHRRPIKIVLSAYVDKYFNDQFQNEFRIFTVLRKPVQDAKKLFRFIADAVQEYEFRYEDPDTKSSDGLMNSEEVIQKMGISRPTLYKYLRSGLPSKQVFGRRFFDWPEVVTWMNRQKNDFSQKE